MKPDEVNIIQISVASGEGIIFGLGDDNNIYSWTNDGEWKLHVQ